MKYIPGNVYKNSIVASLSESISTLLSGLIVKFLGPRNSILLMNTLAVGAAAFLWTAEKNEFPWAALLNLKSSETGYTSRCGGSLISDRWSLEVIRHVLTFCNCADTS